MFIYIIETDTKHESQVSKTYMDKYFTFQANKYIGLFNDKSDFELIKDNFNILKIEIYEYELEKEYKDHHSIGGSPFLYLDSHHRLIKEWSDMHFNEYCHLQLKLNDFVPYDFKRSNLNITRRFNIVE